VRIADEEGESDLVGGHPVCPGDLPQHLASLRLRLRKVPRAEGAVAHDGHLVLHAPGKDLRLDVPRAQVVQHLVARDAPRAGDGQGLLQVVHVEVAQAPAPDLPLPDQLLERGEGVLQRVLSRPVQEVAVQVVRPQPPQARLAGLHRAATAGVVGHHLGDEEHLVAAAGDRAPDQRLRLAAPVQLGGVDVGHPGVEPDLERGQRLGGRVALDLPRALPDERHLDSGPPEPAGLHVPTSSRPRLGARPVPGQGSSHPRSTSNDSLITSAVTTQSSTQRTTRSPP